MPTSARCCAPPVALPQGGVTSPRRIRPAPAPCRGRAPSRPLEKAPFPANSRWFPNASPTPCRGGPMCPPAPSSRDPPTGRHTGRPLRIPLQPPSNPKQRAGTEPCPYRDQRHGTPTTASRSTRPPPTSSPATQNTLHDRRHPVLILRPPSQRKKTPPPVSEQGFPKGAAAPFGRFKGVPGGKQGSRRKPAQRLRWEKEEQRNE